MNSIANSPDALAAIRRRKLALKQKMKASRTQMTDSVSFLAGGPAPKAMGNLHNIGRLVSMGIVAYQGFRFCSGLIDHIHSLFTPRRRRR